MITRIPITTITATGLLVLNGTEIGDAGEHSVAIQHVIRSFDPCMVCTVH
jgi:Ni,Fe-hydrogenase I large subunit